ncbi:hypothetical protein M1B34_31565 [Pseudomonas sp. MAFF 302030]|uniref:Uncharacterized protein n=1 Tax=Pseudomonas morbosilactucae TaxID=2938197 RepID=A0A9X1Z1J4_9PSED|nr:hypothetical protein [Pseudomonas morbosilactucae]
MDIEDTTDWLGIPTPLETCQQHIAMLEDEVQELTRQLRESRQRVFKLVEMYAEVSKERDKLRAEDEKNKNKMSELYLKNSELGNTINSLKIVKAQNDQLHRELSELRSRP